MELPDRPLRLAPLRVGRPWGGGRFGVVAGEPVGELWVSGDDATLPDGRTLCQWGLADMVPLVKILDIAGRLSVQVHPDDRAAVELRGPGAVGKHECWVVLEAPAGASVALGLVPGASADDLFSGDAGRIDAALRMWPVAPGTILDIAPGTVHAPGTGNSPGTVHPPATVHSPATVQASSTGQAPSAWPRPGAGAADGLLLYEVQQRSDLTFRIWDWGRPRPLHLVEARRCLRPAAMPRVEALPSEIGPVTVSAPGAPFGLTSCHLGRGADAANLDLDTVGVLTITRGGLRVTDDGNEPIEMETGSNWLLPPGSWVLTGSGDALLAWGRRPGETTG